MNSLKKFVKHWSFPLLVVGVAIRLILIPITLHPDLWGHSFVAYFFAYEGVFNIYEHLLSLSQNHPLVTNFGVQDIFIYPPLTYFTLGFFRFLTRPFADPNFIPWLMENVGHATSYQGLGVQLLLFKLPYVFVDVGTAYLLSSLFDDKKKKKWAFLLWIFNPITLYATFMIGQLDILPVFFVLLSLYFAKDKKYFWSVFSLGIGGSYKMFPLLFIIPAALVYKKPIWERLKLIIAGFAPFILISLPFFMSAAYRAMVFSPKSQKMLFMKFPVSGAEAISPFVLVLIFLYFFAYYRRKRLAVEHYFLTILLLVLSITHYHPQWFLWVTPFFVIELVRRNFENWLVILTLFLAWLFITLTFEPSLSIGLFAPINPQLSSFPGLSEVLERYTDVFQLKSIARSVFAGASLYLVHSVFVGKNEKA